MKIIVISIIVLLFFTSPAIASADQASDTGALNQQIQFLKQKIAQLTLMIADLQLQQKVSAQSYLVVDIADNSVISQKNATEPRAIASITKLMNAVIVVENISLEEKITLQEEMLKPVGHSPSLFLNANISAKNLLQASLIQSTNDASEALSYFLGNARFLELMNQKARELSMNDTFFYDVHGLSLQNQSTASDIAKLITYIHKTHPQILAITKENNFVLPDQTGRLLKFQNLNNFYQLGEFIGGKTGYLPEVKQSLASLFQVKGKTVVIVLLNSKNRQADARNIIDQVGVNN